MVLGVPKVVVACLLVNSCSLNVTQNTGPTMYLLRHARDGFIGAEAVIHVLNT
jgi:hypothetical protein